MNKLIQLIKDTFPEDYPDNRREKLLKMYHYFEDRMAIAPASGKEHYHNAHVGGYVEHVLHVVDTALKMSDTYEAAGGHKNWTDEELVFSALHHDLGKVGDLNDELKNCFGYFPVHSTVSLVDNSEECQLQLPQLQDNQK